jgi:hypothetical protein
VVVRLSRGPGSRGCISIYMLLSCTLKSDAIGVSIDAACQLPRPQRAILDIYGMPDSLWSTAHVAYPNQPTHGLGNNGACPPPEGVRCMLSLTIPAATEETFSSAALTPANPHPQQDIAENFLHHACSNANSTPIRPDCFPVTACRSLWRTT